MMNLPNLNRAQVSLAVAMAFASTVVVAQSTPNIGDALRQVQPPVVPAKSAPALPAVGGAPQIEAPMTALPGGAQVAVKQIEVVGNRVIDTATLAALVADGAGQSLTLPELEALAQRITKHYRAHGYFVARAYIPAQEVSSGTLKIRVVEGNYGQFHLKNQSLVRDDIVQRMLDDVKSADIVSLDTLERVMLIINDTPGVQVTRADVMPGTKVGTSDFAVDTVATPRYAGYVMLDNYGSAYTGKNRLSFNLDANSPTGSGDRLSVSGLATNGDGLYNGRVGYSTSLAANGLRGEVAVSQTQYQLGGAYAALDAVGTAKAVDATLSYPIRRIRAQTLEASLTASYKDLLDEVRSTGVRTPKSSASATAALSLRDERTVFGFDGLTQASVAVTYGQLEFHDAAALALDTAGPNTNGSYSKMVASLTRVSLLSQNLTLTASLKVQQVLNGKSLDGSERMAVSGSSGVLAYPSGELIGDKAVLARLELSRPLPAVAAVRSNWLVFADYGEARAEKTISPSSGNRHVSDVGIGLNANCKGALLKATLAHRLEGQAAVSEPTPRNKVLVQAGWVF